MEVEDQFTVDAPREVIVEEMQKPDALKEVIPNCQEVTEVAEREYEAKVSERISMVSLDMEIEISITEFNPPESFDVNLDGTAPGSNTDVSATMTYNLSELDDDSTLIDYYMDIEVSGKLASLGFRMLKSTVNKRIEQMTDNVQELFEEQKAPQ